MIIDNSNKYKQILKELKPQQMSRLLTSSRLHTISQYYNLAHTAEQKEFQTKEFLQATYETIDELAFSLEEALYDLRKENEELSTRLDRAEAMIELLAKPDTFTADIELSKPSLKQARKDIEKLFRF